MCGRGGRSREIWQDVETGWVVMTEGGNGCVGQMERGRRKSKQISRAGRGGSRAARGKSKEKKKSISFQMAMIRFVVPLALSLSLWQDDPALPLLLPLLLQRRLYYVASPSRAEITVE
jgi:hypothetical protein